MMKEDRFGFGSEEKVLTVQCRSPERVLVSGSSDFCALTRVYLFLLSIWLSLESMFQLRWGRILLLSLLTHFLLFSKSPTEVSPLFLRLPHLPFSLFLRFWFSSSRVTFLCVCYSYASRLFLP